MRTLDSVLNDLVFVKVMNKVCLFTESRLDHHEIPDGFFAYDLRHGDEDWSTPCEISPFILVNFYGTVISDKPIPEFEKWDRVGKSNKPSIDFKPETDWESDIIDGLISDDEYNRLVDEFLNPEHRIHSSEITTDDEWHYDPEKITYIW